MKKIAKQGIWIVFIALLLANVYVFVSGVALSDEISKFDIETTKLHAENLELEKKLYSVESLNYAASIAAQMNFTNAAPPVYLDQQTFALNR